MRRLLLPLFMLAAIGGIATQSRACLWDRDTLAAEARGLPGVIDIIVGRFDRWPDEVYATRLERVERDVEADPTRLDLYDDAGVACDRLGRHTEAIEWMARKRAALDAESRDQADHEYRYLANLGTFYAHRWLANGADRGDMGDIERARDLIADAIELNPDAHFGREKYQLAAIKWIIDAPTDKTSPHAGAFVRWTRDFPFLDPEPVRVYSIADEIPSEQVIEGLTGLVVLGNAQSSIDIHYAIATAARAHGDSHVAYLALLRCDELLRDGHRPISGALQPFGRFTSDGTAFTEVIDTGPRAQVEAYFETARRAAIDRNSSRDTYILAQIAAGKHPDTHAEFMAGFKEPRAPKVPNGFLGLDSMQQWILSVVMLFFMLPMGIAAALWFGIRHLIRRNRAKRRLAA